MKKLFLIPLIIVVVAGLVLGGCAKPAPAPAPPAPAPPAPAPAPETITLIGSFHESPASKRVTGCYDVWMDKIEKETNGRVKFERYYAESLIPLKDKWDEMLAGTADVGDIVLHISPGPSVMPIQCATQRFFYGCKDFRTNVEIYYQMIEEFPELGAEFKDIKDICFMGVGEQSLHSVVPVRTLDDFKGLSLRSTGPWLAYTWKALGAEPVALPPTEIYTSLEKGIIDGHPHPMEALESWKFAEVEPYSTLLHLFDGVGARGIAMNWDSYNALPPDIQKIIDDSIPWVRELYITNTYKIDQSGMDFANKLGHEYIELSPQDLAAFYKVTEEEARVVAGELDAKGLPGTKIFERVQQLIAETK